jgi:hypothetical protein
LEITGFIECTNKTILLPDNIFLLAVTREGGLQLKGTISHRKKITNKIRGRFSMHDSSQEVTTFSNNNKLK